MGGQINDSCFSVSSTSNMSLILGYEDCASCSFYRLHFCVDVVFFHSRKVKYDGMVVKI